MDNKDENNKLEFKYCNDEICIYCYYGVCHSEEVICGLSECEYVHINWIGGSN